MAQESALEDTSVDLAGSLADLCIHAAPSDDARQFGSLRKRLPPRLVPVHVQPQVDLRLYRYESDHIGTTSHWSEAANRTQGVPHALTARLSNKSKPSRRRPGAYAVFFGRQPGVYDNWESARLSVDGVSGAIFQGYATLDLACKAFAYADARTWTRSGMQS
ncbi:hypothetical protein C8J57DRAFT_1493511 [Mycena rebaudengoi]|nr:hypothetical protein C8J57DRAFT_1493511 [Mycena rebaudengoi]